MATHDAYARLTPYELFLPEGDFAAEHFGAIEEEAERSGRGLDTPADFAMLMAVGHALDELRGPEDEPRLIEQHAALLFHAFHFWRADRPVYLLETQAARRVVSGAGDGRLEVRGPPESAGYLQLPQHLFWARGDEGGTPESIDGLFWAVRGETLLALGAMGMRPDRPGFTVIYVPAVPTADRRRWVTEPMRDGGTDFESSLPGAELDRLYEIRSPGELLELLALTFSVPGTSRERWPGAPADGGTGAGPEPSELPFVRLSAARGPEETTDSVAEPGRDEPSVTAEDDRAGRASDEGVRDGVEDTGADCDGA